MRVLLIGGKGSIGRRYQACLARMGQKVHVYDTVDKDSDVKIFDRKWDRVIIASPTHTHFPYAIWAARNGIPFLCEKPMSFKIYECEKIVERTAEGFVVCNYGYLADYHGFENPKIIFDYYNTGKDGLLWDCCQLIYLDPRCILRNTSPAWELYMNGRRMVGHVQEMCFYSMVVDFISGYWEKLWTVQDGLLMTKAVLERIKREDTGRDSGEDKLDEASGEDLRGDLRKANAGEGIRKLHERLVRKGGRKGPRPEVRRPTR